ncbi:hypothetical protein Syun_028895 [Stephania yunnanensis]|uniref:Reverse transcriptase zinc-binding domain-containing protein n=1 Tax=Stephania yunnanensis TaxID=152371 RepID=A0AAP0E4I9_9MAGN
MMEPLLSKCSLSLHQNQPISFFASFRNEIDEINCVWNLHLPNRIPARFHDEKCNLLNVLEQARLHPNLEDKRIWNFDPSNIFTCKSFFHSLIDDPSSHVHQAFKGLWKAMIPSKAKFFGWLLLHGGLNTYEKLQRRMPHLFISPHCCFMCMMESENVNHLFFQCNVACQVWDRWDVFSGGLVSNPRSMFGLKAISDRLIGKSRRKHIIGVATLAILWGLWLERNKRLFEDKEQSIEPCGNQVN